MPEPNPIAFFQPRAPGTVSVVIPTRGRPRMVLSAVESALAQTWPPLEVIVVIDGPETVLETAFEFSTLDTLSRIADSRLKVVSLARPVGGSDARNHGVHIAQGDWIAFLDDDDLWLPEKLAVQLTLIALLPVPLTPEHEAILSCNVLARAPSWEEVWPRTPYRPRQPVAEYLFCRHGWRYGEALLQTSTLLAPRRLLKRVPFTPGLGKHQDWDWLLRAAAQPGVRVYCAGAAPLVIFHVEGDRSSVSRAHDWTASLAWARERRQFFTPRAFRGFLATECAAQAQHAPWRERLALFRLLLAAGFPQPAEILQTAAFLLVSQRLRRSLRDAFRMLRSRAVASFQNV